MRMVLNSWLPDHRFHIDQLEAEVLPSTGCHFLPVLCDFQRRRMNTDIQEAGIYVLLVYFGKVCLRAMPTKS